MSLPTNRLTEFLAEHPEEFPPQQSQQPQKKRKDCKCCRIRRRLRKLAKECMAVEALAGVFQFITPSFSSYAKGKREVQMFLELTHGSARVGDDLRVFATLELRNLARQLTDAADRLQGAQQP